MFYVAIIISFSIGSVFGLGLMAAFAAGANADREMYSEVMISENKK